MNLIIGQKTGLPRFARNDGKWEEITKSSSRAQFIGGGDPEFNLCSVVRK